MNPLNVVTLLLAACYAQLCKGSRFLDSLAEVQTHAISFLHQHTERSQHPLGYAIVKSTYRSLAMPLAPGQMIFTDASKTPLEMPTGEYSLLGFRGEIVDEQNKSVPLSTVYDHHWIAQDGVHKNPFCEVEYVFGIGAESRKTPTNFPAGYGYRVSDTASWGGNIHLLHTEHLAGSSAEIAAKECNECYYAPGKGPRCTPEANGTFQCCGDNCYDGSCFCPVAESAPVTQTKYYLQYSVTYTRDAVTPVQIGVWTTPHCRTFYEVLRDDEHPEHLSSTGNQRVDADFDVVFAVGHQHTGALNISLFLNDQLFCTSYPTYGTEDGVAGNEKNHLIKMSNCINKDVGGPMKVRKGDLIRLDSWYYVGSNDPRLGPGLGGTHLNVMGYMYMAIAAAQNSDAFPKSIFLQ